MRLVSIRPEKARTRRLPSTQGGRSAQDFQSLAAELRRALRGEVRFDDGSRALYATDASNYRLVPIGVVIPRTLEDVEKAVALCRQHGAPVLSRGGGTSLGGQCTNVAVVLDWSKYLNRILEIDPARKIARVLPGAVLDDVRRTAEKRYQLTVGPDPATHNHCTLGGMIGNNACGMHAQMAGSMSHNVEAMEVLTYDGLRMKVGPTPEQELALLSREPGRRGQIYRALRNLRDRYAEEIRRRFPKIPRRISGYNLDSLLPENGFNLAAALVGSEGTCVAVLEAAVRLVHSPPARTVLVVGYNDIFEAGDDVPRFDALKPLAFEGIDHRLIRNVQKKGLHAQYLSLMPEGRGFLFLEFGGETLDEARDRARMGAEHAHRLPGVVSAKVFDKLEDIVDLWELRESGLGATARVPGERDTWPGWEDSAVPPDQVGSYLRAMRALYDKYGYNASLYGHFGQGCVHTRIDFDLTSARGISQFRAFLDEASDACLAHGGSLSGEHGDGQARSELLPKMFGDALVQAFREFKGIWDPAGKMNPGRIVDPRAIDADLRLGIDAQTWQPSTYFPYQAEDQGSFFRATQRCVGVGKCRREGGGTMCPSFMVTREEEHSTRGRAHLLFEMMKGEAVRGGWRDEAVKKSLDLCLSCKGCKGDCPVNVDMATYKAEFLAHYYRGRLRPASAYAMGLIMVWARLASLAPGLVNSLTHTKPIEGLAKRLGGIAPQRTFPRFAPETFRSWFSRTRVAAPKATDRRVMLWPDTFNNHFFPETARAALEVLESGGYQVVIPRRALCCGRPLYDYGMLPTAKRFLRKILSELEPEIEAGTPIVGLEPSCVSVFRDELPGLFPHDAAARQLSRQVLLFGEFLQKNADDLPIPKLSLKAFVQGHCHHKSLFQMDDEKSVLQRMGLDFEIADSGCCGMAGSFGFEKGERYEVAVKAGERVLLPRVREEPITSLIVADGFSCREQIAQGTNREALHLAQVVRMAQEYASAPPKLTRPEGGWVTHGLGERAPRRRKAAVAGLGLSLLGAAAGALLWRRAARSLAP